MSVIFTQIKKAVLVRKLKEPFSVSNVNLICPGLIESSPSFLSKHAENNPGGYSAYFVRISRGKYKLK
jgi:hypothetical protein